MDRALRRRGSARSVLLLVGAIVVGGGAVTAGVLSRTPGGSSPRSVSPVSPGMGTALHSVACASSRWCIAVGAYSTDGSSNHEHALVELWDGAGWSLVHAPSPSADTELFSVACLSAQACEAVGSSGSGSLNSQRAFAVYWDGSSWSTQPVPSPREGSALAAVTCPRPGWCLGVGSSTNAGFPMALVETWNGRAWSMGSVPAPTGSADSWLDAITCSLPSSCMAVGAYSNSGDFEDPENTTLTESWNGVRWSVIPSPTPGAGNLAALAAVACESPSSCLAVGNYSNTNNPYRVDSHGLVESWNGSGWSVGTGDAFDLANQTALQAITCVAGGRCLAVGSSSGTAYGSTRSLVQVWNGASWTVAARLPLGGALESITCVSQRSCLAVGERASTTNPNQQGFAEWWSAPA